MPEIPVPLDEIELESGNERETLDQRAALTGLFHNQSLILHCGHTGCAVKQSLGWCEVETSLFAPSHVTHLL
ncbi:hypothetical protein TCAL_16343 [Tigriopus californicus]|uniref:Uncharacterized protein n=1 Tax=Tigriopus californicus TaxID=6832 RepID=A0A553N6B2_TIGCA|nr:hypothetical protein TCAL_16343 [Tigriopus californicus]